MPGRYTLVAQELHSAQKTAELLDKAVSTASEASQVVSQASPVLGRAGQAAVALSQDLVSAIQRLTLSSEISKEFVLDLRMRMAQAKLQTDMISSFLIEVSEHGASNQTAAQITSLSNALELGIADLESTLAAANSGLLGISDDITAIDESFTEFQRMLHTWRQLVSRFNLSGQLTGQLAPIDEQLNDGRTRMAQLQKLGEACNALSEPVDTAPLRLALQEFEVAQRNQITQDV